MNLIKIVSVYHHLEEVAALRLPYPKARLIAEVQRKAREELEFYSAEERKLVAQYAAKIEQGGRITFNTPEDMEAYKAAVTDLENLDVEWPFAPITLTAGDVGAQSISPNTIAQLEGIINWKE